MTASTTTLPPSETKQSLLHSKWVQLLLGLLCMMAISSPQYVWALFTKPFLAELKVELAALQVTFSILIVLQTFFSPFQGYLVDRFGPRLLLTLGALLTGLSWILSAQITSVWGLYMTYGLLGGLGTGIVYVGVVGLMVRWFPTSRGFAVGMVAAGYGMGAIVTTFPISSSLTQNGFQQTLTLFGALMAIVGMIAAQGLRIPASLTQAIADGVGSSTKVQSVKPLTMLKTPIFWLMFAMMTMMSTSGLMVISQMGAFAKNFGVADAMVWGMAALPLALTIDRFTNGLTRQLFGFISDRLGRENTMFIAFGLEAIAMFAAKTQSCLCCCLAWSFLVGAKSFRFSLQRSQTLLVKNMRRPTTAFFTWHRASVRFSAVPLLR